MTVEFLGLLVLLLLGSLFALVSDVDVVLMWTGMWPCCLSCSSTWLWPQGADGWSPVLSICSGWFDHLDPPTATSVLSTNNQQHSHLRSSFPALFPFCLLVSLLFPLLRWRICAQWSRWSSLPAVGAFQEVQWCTNHYGLCSPPFFFFCFIQPTQQSSLYIPSWWERLAWSLFR